MFDETAVALLVVVVVVPSALPAATSLGNEPPLADAGLDQTVQMGATVLLDGGGSRDPDGEIDAYRWEITAPNGSTLAPRCPTCKRTRFVPDQKGVYEVRLTVTDDDGAARSDTLYVTVNDGAGPTVSLAGPERTEAGKQVRYDVTVDAGDAKLAELVWRVDGTVVRRDGLSGRHGQKKLRRTFSTAGTRNLTVTVVDEAGNRASDSLTVSVVASGNDAPSASILGPDEVRKGEKVTFDLVASDPDGDNVTVSWHNVDYGNRTGATKNFSGYAAGDTATITATVTDAHGESVTVTKEVEVVSGTTDSNGGTRTTGGTGSTSSNEQPTATIKGPDRVQQGNWSTFEVEASDPDGKIVDIAWSNVYDSGLEDPISVVRKFDEDTGTTVTITVTVTDDDGATTTATKTVSVIGNSPFASGEQGGGPNSSTDKTVKDPDKDKVELTSLRVETNRGAATKKSGFEGTTYTETENTLTFTVEAKVTKAEAGDTVMFTIQFGDGQSAIVTRMVPTNSTTSLRVAIPHSYSNISERTTRTVRVTAAIGKYTSAPKTGTLTFVPNNEDARRKTRWSVSLSGPDSLTTGETGIFTVSHTSDKYHTPPKVRIRLDDGTKYTFNPADLGEFTKTIQHSYSHASEFTAHAVAFGTTGNGQTGHAKHTVTVEAKTYTVWQYTKAESKQVTKTQKSASDPGPLWTYESVARTFKQPVTSVATTRITQPRAMSDPKSRNPDYVWKQVSSTYDPVLDAWMETFRLYEITTIIKWENTVSKTVRGTQTTSLTKPAPSDVWKNTLTKKQYKCTNADAPKHDQACSSSGTTGSAT